MNIPMLDLKAQYETIKEEINEKVLGVMASQNFILGAEVAALEEEIAASSGARFGIGVSSGSDALIISLMALGIGPGDTVVTTPFTFFATAGAIARLGARTVFCDIDPVTYNIDPASCEEVLNSLSKKRRRLRVKAILPVHLYGQCADMDPLLKLAGKGGYWIVEDAAQAIGSEYPGRNGLRRAGTMGIAGTLSFYPSKNLGGYGDGGMVLTDNARLADKLRMLRVHGGIAKYHYKILGGNFRLDALQAAILRVKFRHLDDWQEKRRSRADYYTRKFAESGLEGSGLVKPPLAVYKGCGARHYHTYHQYVVRVKNRGRLQACLKTKGIGTSVFYPLSLHQQKCFADLGYKKGDFPVSERAAREVLALPIYPELTPEQQDYIVETIREFYA
ncbi:MAG: DegT/DnrJ/EryC1/StrS family aminotransferase [Candidatus Aminicenantes bacterium]|nr:DegT/DnrJ/EryC1/StrS family aminotransferase [Candidatus Aminicenantes bacterium]